MAELDLPLGDDVEPVAVVALPEQRIAPLERRLAHELTECLKILRVDVLEERNRLENASVHLLPFLQ